MPAAAASDNVDTLPMRVDELPTPKSPEIPIQLGDSQDAEGKRRAYQNLPDIPMDVFPKKRLFKKTSLSTDDLEAAHEEVKVTGSGDVKDKSVVINEEREELGAVASKSEDVEMASQVSPMEPNEPELPGPSEPTSKSVEQAWHCVKILHSISYASFLVPIALPTRWSLDVNNWVESPSRGREEAVAAAVVTRRKVKSAQSKRRRQRSMRTRNGKRMR